MYTPIDIDKIQKERNQALVRTLERIRTELNLGLDAWAEMLQIKAVEYEKIRQGVKPLSALSLFSVAQKLALDPLALDSGKIDYVALVQAHTGNRSYVSPRFRLAASSRKFTVVNTLNFVEKYRGSHLRVAANRHFQIHEDFWSDWQDPNSERINIRFLGDLWKFLRDRGLADEDFRSIGFHSIVTYRNTYLGRRLSALQDPKEVYSYLINDLMDSIEQNHIYRITQLTDGACVIESRSNPHIAEALSVRQIGTIEGCQVKIGLIQSMPIFVGRPAAVVNETHCVHRGDSVCRFFCDFSGGVSSDVGTRRLSLLT